MGSLAEYLQDQFISACPPNWVARKEVDLLPQVWCDLLGYGARADLLLDNIQTNQRIWIEFEVSRADPVANHAKFATSHLFSPLLPSESFVSMLTQHVTRGRSNLAASTIALMRKVGINAFQTYLLPNISTEEIKRLNHLDDVNPLPEIINIRSELERVFSIVEPITANKSFRIHFVGNNLEVLMNLRQWNNDMAINDNRIRWGKRTVTYFVYDRFSENFAPSKYCAYLLLKDEPANSCDRSVMTGMSVKEYCSIDQKESCFDGALAKRHLIHNLNFVAHPLCELPKLEKTFQTWLEKHQRNIAVHPGGAVILVKSSSAF